MNTQEIVAKLWNLCNVLRDDGITYHQYVTELTYILFLKMAKETDVETKFAEGVITLEGDSLTAEQIAENAQKQIIKDYSWDVLKGKSGIELYNYYKDLYTRKYGNPTISKEKNPAHSDSNTALMAEVHQGTVVWGSAWEVTGGDIELSIEKTSGIYEGMVMIRYRDSQNVETKIQKDLEDI